MLHKKARPKRKEIPTNTCKGVGNLTKELYRIYHDIVYSKQFHTFGKALTTSIPILSIFAFLGITSYSFGLFNIGLISSILSDNTNGEVYAAESTNTATTSSLIIDNGTASDSTATARSNVAYSSHTVQVKASNIESYQLTITGPTNLTNDGTTISGAGNKTPANMANNTWGYGWNTTSTADASMTYNSFTGSAQTLENNTSISNNAVNLTKKLVFAAKFDQNAASGHYRANVKLNLTITPKQVLTLKQISKMQEMDTDVCAASTIGDTATLTDSRDSSTYTIRKHEDSKCWMTQNLRLVGSRTLNSGDSDVTASYGLPAPTTANFVQYGSSAGAYYNNSTSYGAYYNILAATAGQATSSSNSNSGEINSSVCPKGWKLPATNDFVVLFNSIGVTNNASGSTLIQNDTYKFQLAGRYAPSFTESGTIGWYQTRSLSAGDYGPNTLYISNSSPYIDLWSAYLRYGLGGSVRCVAYDNSTQYTYSATFRGREQDGGNILANSFSVKSPDKTFTFSLYYGYYNDYSGGSDCRIASWKDAAGSTYSGSTQYTLESSNPNIILTVESLGRCDPT